MTEGNSGTVVFTTLAMNQTRFFAALGEAMAAKGFKAAYICFHQRSYEYLEKRGHKAYNIYEKVKQVGEVPDLASFGIEDYGLFINHEMVTFNIKDKSNLEAKIRRYIAGVDLILKELESDGNRSIFMVQELGGFVSLAAAYYAARSRGIENIFMEPSFFQGRLFFIRNSFNALPIPDPGDIQISSEVEEYIDTILNWRNPVVPKKDTHHFRPAVMKLTDQYNIRRLFEKLFDKYVLNKKEEFQHIGEYVAHHLRMFVNNSRLKKFYKPLAPGERFVYYPLHVPNDAALTIRSPEYLDQYAFLDYAAGKIPKGHDLYIKEHPARVGAVDYGRIRRLLLQHENLKILNPTINNYDVMEAADVVITINSKSGAEAMLLGKPVIALGDAFYTPSQLVLKPERLEDLPAFIEKALEKQQRSNPDDVRRYFQNVWDQSWPGEIHYAEPENVRIFAESLGGYLTGATVKSLDKW